MIYYLSYIGATSHVREGEEFSKVFPVIIQVKNWMQLDCLSWGLAVGLQKTLIFTIIIQNMKEKQARSLPRSLSLKEGPICYNTEPLKKWMNSKLPVSLRSWTDGQNQRVPNPSNWCCVALPKYWSCHYR